MSPCNDYLWYVSVHEKSSYWAMKRKLAVGRVRRYSAQFNGRDVYILLSLKSFFLTGRIETSHNREAVESYNLKKI